MRRLRILAAATLVGLTLAGPAHAGGSIDSGPWQGTRFTTVSSSSWPAPSITATFNRRDFSGSISFSSTASPAAGQSLPAGCTPTVGGASAGPPTRSGQNSTWFASAPASFPCNGLYAVSMTAQLQGGGLFAPGEAQATVDGTIAITAPPPDVNASAQPQGRSVVVRWQAPAAPPDFLGYRVERQGPDGAWVTLTSLNTSATSYTDHDLPAAGGPVTYRVVGRRSGPHGEVPSRGGNPATAQVEAVATTTTTTPTTPGVEPSIPGPTPDPTDGGGTGDPGTPADGGDPGQPGDPGNPTAPSGGGGGAPSGGGITMPRLGITGTFLPPLLQPTAGTVRPTGTTLDTFDEHLPYGEGEAGSEDPVLPGDEMASLLMDGDPGRGMVIPVATGLVLAVWAFHLRFLARISRPTV